MLYESERGGVHTVAQIRRCWSIVEDVAEVPVAFGTRDRGADHTETCVTNFRDVLLCNGRPEARPSRAGLEFRCGIEERIVAANASVDTFLVQVPVLAGESHLGIGVARDVVSVGREQLAPFSCGLHDFR